MLPNKIAAIITQKRTGFLDFLLRRRQASAKGIKAFLEAEKGWNETASETSGYVVVFGLVLEVIYVIAFPDNRSISEILLILFSDALVALGVFFEVRFGNRASKRSSELEKLAERDVTRANARAASALQKAEEEARARIEFETQASRRAITKEQYMELQKLSGFIDEIVILASDDFETKRFALQIVKTLLHADVKSHLSGMRLTEGFGAGGIVSVIDDIETDVVYAAFKRAKFNFAGAKRSEMPFSFIPSNTRIICVLENPSTAKDWPPDAWKEK